MGGGQRRVARRSHLQEAGVLRRGLARRRRPVTAGVEAGVVHRVEYATGRRSVTGGIFAWSLLPTAPRAWWEYSSGVPRPEPNILPGPSPRAEYSASSSGDMLPSTCRLC